MGNGQTLTVFRNEPILSLAVRLGATPFSLSVYFFIVISLSLTVFGGFIDSPGPWEKYLSYWRNISWSISIVTIFPLIIGLTLKYYYSISDLFSELSTRIRDEQESEYNQFLKTLDSRFNSFWISFFVFFVVVFVNYAFYYFPMLINEPYGSWISNGELFKDVVDNLAKIINNYEGLVSGFSRVGFYSSVLQVVMVYWIAMLVSKCIVFIWGLWAFFNRFEFRDPIDPMHEDGVCGFQAIGKVALNFNYILFLLGIYISLKIIDKTMFAGQTITEDIGNPLFITLYIFLAPFLFFFPLAAAHEAMKRAKKSYIQPLIIQRAKLIEEEKNSVGANLENIDRLANLINKLRKEISVWPFDFRSLERFAAVAITPFIPTIITFLFSILSDLGKS